MTTTCPACGHESAILWRCEHCGHDLVDVDDDDDDDGSAAPPLVADGGERRDPAGGRAVHPPAERFEAAEVSREARDDAHERHVRREVESQQREGQAVDQEPDDGRCPDCRGDVLPCLDCWLNGGDE